MEPIKLVIEVLIHSDGKVEYLASGGAEHFKGDMPKKKDFHIEKVKFYCARYKRKVNKKPENSCRGCTIQCHLKGKYKGEIIEV